MNKVVYKPTPISFKVVDLSEHLNVYDGDNLGNNYDDDDIKVIDGYNILSDSIIYKLNPNIINLQEFWKLISERFPTQVYGLNTSDTVEKFNHVLINKLEIPTRALPTLMKVIKYRLSSRILEIRPKIGGVYDYITERGYIGEYHVVDFINTTDLENYHLLDNDCLMTEVPELVDNFDVIYSSSFIQHLSPKLMINLFNAVYSKLRLGGVFIFTAHVVSDDNRATKHGSGRLFGLLDNLGRPYTAFYGMFSLIPELDWIMKFFTGLGADIEVVLSVGNISTFKIIKN